jgi:4-hydroxy-tetrahydrodipicolinate synthase
MLYNVPGTYGSVLGPETVLCLAEVSNIVAIKEASGSLDQASDIHDRLRLNFGIYSGMTR